MSVQRSDIIQIIPAEGWEAHYAAGPTTEIYDVACFALHHNGDIDAMVMGNHGRLIYATQRAGFIKCLKLENTSYV